MENFSNKEKSNIGYWEQVLTAPTQAYQDLFEAEKKYLIEHIQTDSKVLDIGCGDGRNIQSILEKTKNIYGIDNDSDAVEMARSKFSNIETVEIKVASADKLPFESEIFDAVTFLMILPNLENNKEDSLIESARVLKKGGNLILSTFSETAFDERMKIYKMVKVPIKKIEGTKFIFDDSLGANTSEQFSLDELSVLGEKAQLKIVDSVKVGDLAYIVKYQK